MSLFSEIVEDHKLPLFKMYGLKARAESYEEFGNGFVMLVPEANGNFRLLTAAFNNKYNNSMWRHIRTQLKRRKGPTYMQFTANYDILYKASKRYGGIELFDGIVLFP